MKTIIAKFYVSEIDFFGSFEGVKLKLTAVDDSDISEDRKFHQYTPQGSIEMTITNPSIVADVQNNVGEWKGKKLLVYLSDHFMQVSD